MPISENTGSNAPLNQNSTSSVGAKHSVEKITKDSIAKDSNALPVETWPVSIWLYIAGLCATLTGLYAVNFGLDDTNFTLVTNGLAVCGFVFSYLMRVRRQSAQTLRLMLVILASLLLIGWELADPGIHHSFTTGDDRSRSLQILLGWLAIGYSFMLSTNGGVLFSCVPAMAIIALVSTSSPEVEMQSAFLVFICSATFLLVHENYLRTRSASIVNPSKESERRLFGGQLILATVCVVSAFLLAHIVAVPIQTVGQVLQMQRGLAGLNNPLSAVLPKNNPFNLQNEGSTIEISTGPVAESDVPVIRIRSNAAYNWRGTTFDRYTGHSFENTLGPPVAIPVTSNRDDLKNLKDFHPVDDTGTVNKPAPKTSTHVPPSAYDLPPEAMLSKQIIKQEVTILSGSYSQIYSAGCISDVEGVFPNGLSLGASGNVVASDSQRMDAVYKTTSYVPTNDAALLRSAPADFKDIPGLILGQYLQLTSGPEATRMQHLANQITDKLTNNYDKAVAIQLYISSNCKYNLQTPPTPSGEDRVDYFLTKSREGYCDSFASAMTMLCRYAGIPSRMASGYLTGDVDKDGSYLIRQKHKHVWTEVFFPNYGWYSFDATLDAEDISDHNQRAHRKRTNFLAWLTSNGWLPPSLLLCVVALLAYLIKTEIWPRIVNRRKTLTNTASFPATNRAIIEIYVNLRSKLAQRGVGDAASTTPTEFAALLHGRAGSSLPELGDKLRKMTELHALSRYSPKTCTEEELTSAQQVAAEILFSVSKAPTKILHPPITL